jgi:hypothetical protein
MDYNYLAFGLRICSQIELPELIRDGSQTVPDVYIAIGKVPEHLPHPQLVPGRYFESDQGQLLVNLKELGRILIENGEKITLELDSQAKPIKARIALLNLGLSAILHQRGALAMHASAIVTQTGIVLFCGQRQAGKSTLAAALRQRGWPLAGDDKAAVYLESGHPWVIPSFPQLRLWRDAIEQLSLAGETMEQIPQTEKYNIRTSEGFCQDPHPLRAIFSLKPAETDQIDLHILQGMQKFHVLRQHTYAHQFLKGLGLLPAHFKLASAVALQTPITEITRPNQKNRLEELVNRVETELRRL